MTKKKETTRRAPTACPVCAEESEAKKRYYDKPPKAPNLKSTGGKRFCVRCGYVEKA